MKPSATLYFIYCLVASRWGKSVKIKRASLHSLYKVNKHGVELSGVSPHQMLYHLTHELWNVGYNEKDTNVFVRVNNGVKTHVNFSLQHERLDVTVFTYPCEK